MAPPPGAFSDGGDSDFEDAVGGDTSLVPPTPPPAETPVFEGKGKLRKRAAQDKKDKAASAAAALLLGTPDLALVIEPQEENTTPTPTSPTLVETPVDAPSTVPAPPPPTPATPTVPLVGSVVTSFKDEATGNPWGGSDGHRDSSGAVGMTASSSTGNTSLSSDYSEGGSPTTPNVEDGSLSPLEIPSARPFSLTSEPETPTSPASSYGNSPQQQRHSLASHSHNATDVPGDGEQSIAGIWRSSERGSRVMVDVELDALQEEDDSFVEGSVREEEGDKKKARRKTVMPTSVSGQSYDFLLQRLEAQNSQLETDPKAKRASMQGNTKIRASFERVHRELGEEQGEIDWDFWGRVMSDYEEVASTQPRELSRAIQKGIPPALRGMTWQLMAASKDQELEHIYAQLLKETSQHEKSISRDLSRTFPKLDYFRKTRDGGGVGQENLFNVVKAYSLYDEEVGYTQGLQFIVGPLLLNMPDEEAFCVLVRLMKSYDLRSHYTPNMPGLQLRLFQFDRLLEELLPGVFMHLLRQGVKSSMYASQWFLTLFGYRFPLELVCSVFDLVFAEGVEAIFRFSVAILKRNEKIICELEFEHLLEFLKNGLYEAYAPEESERDGADEEPLYRAHEFVREALQIKITPLMLDQFGEEWENLCAQQNAHTAEIENLRKANSQLSNQVRGLEASLSQINLEHCDLVRQVVMSKLEREELEDELIKYKIMFADLAHLQAEGGANSYRLSQERKAGQLNGAGSSY